MKRFILTGAPGSGKTAIIRQLAFEGFSVVEEAATDIIACAQGEGIAKPWKKATFIDEIVTLQRDRQMQTSRSSNSIQTQFHDRSAICTAALAAYLDYAITPALAAEIERIKREAIFEQQVFFIRNLGFITNTEARRITFEETLRFEKIHEETYRHHGFELIQIAPGTVADRVTRIRSLACS